jgi:hypothetical protein
MPQTVTKSTAFCYGFQNNVNLIEFFSTKQINTLTPIKKEGRLIPKGFGYQGNSNVNSQTTSKNK